MLLDPKLREDWPFRVCLPYGLELFDLARWVSLVGQVEASPSFAIHVGQRCSQYSKYGAIDLYEKIQRDCIGYDLACSYVISDNPRSLFFFDQYDRFSFFAAESIATINVMFPFSRDLCWENFALSQEEQDEPLEEVFREVHSC